MVERIVVDRIGPDEFEKSDRRNQDPPIDLHDLGERPSARRPEDHEGRVGRNHATKIRCTRSGRSRNGIDPSGRSWIVGTPMSTAVAASPGTPRVGMGRKAPPVLPFSATSRPRLFPANLLQAMIGDT